MKAAAEALLGKTQTSFLKQAAKHPDPGFSAYLVRRLEHQLEPSRLAAMRAEEKARLAKDLRAELDQLRRINKVASVYAGTKESLFKTILDSP